MRWKSGGADSVQVWAFGTKIILVTSACSFISIHLHVMIHQILYNLQDTNEETLHSNH